MYINQYAVRLTLPYQEIKFKLKIPHIVDNVTEFRVDNVELIELLSCPL